MGGEEGVVKAGIAGKPRPSEGGPFSSVKLGNPCTPSEGHNVPPGMYVQDAHETCTGEWMGITETGGSN